MTKIVNDFIVSALLKEHALKNKTTKSKIKRKENYYVKSKKGNHTNPDRDGHKTAHHSSGFK